MGQEQSYAHASATQVRRYRENQYEDPLQYRHATNQYRSNYDKRVRRSGTSLKSDTTESSGYRSETSSAYECRSTASDDYCRLSLYKNDHYKDVSKELYKPVKIKEKRHSFQFVDSEKADAIKNAKITTYLTDTEKNNLKTKTKTLGIRNYTPKILSEEEKQKQLDNWL